VDLKWLALHELGHSLGLEHSSTKGAVMYPIYSGYHPGLQLHRDDILGIQQLYGKLNLSCNVCPLIYLSVGAIFNDKYMKTVTMIKPSSLWTGCKQEEAITKVSLQIFL